MYDNGVIRKFSNVGLTSPARIFPGLPKRTDVENYILTARGALKLELFEGDLLSLSSNCGQPKIKLAVIDARGADGLSLLDLAPDSQLSANEYDSDELIGWTTTRGLTSSDLTSTSITLNDTVILKAQARGFAWIVLPIETSSFVDGVIPGEAVVSVQRAHQSSANLPEPLADVRDEFTIKRGTAQAYEVAKGEIVQIIDVEGQQCSDFQSFRTAGLDQSLEFMIDSTATRSMVRQSYPSPGLLDKFFDRELRPMLRVIQDTCGRHDTFGLACTARGYEERGFPGHVNCSDNISNAVTQYGVERRNAWPAINFFWNTWIDPHTHHLLTEESHSRPGDYVAMQALDDLVCVSTACPDDVDPINGWNPTDVHVRIYRPDAPIRRAVAYREKEDAPMSISRESAFHSRTSVLTQHFAPARDLWTPVSFPATGTTGEYWACRENVTIQDMSGLRKYDIVGPDAEKLLQRALTRDISRLAVWRGTYALMCDDTGAVIDDGTLFRIGPDLFRWCCGTEESARVLKTLARDEGLNVRIHNMSRSLVNLAVQGPKSRDLLREVAFTQPHVPSLDHLKWFGATVARIKDREGAPFMLTRTGYTGELGYEIFCTSGDAEAIWDALIEAGKPHGIVPMGNAALDIVRIEAGLAAAGAEFAPGSDAFESGLGFAVDLKKSDFVGKAALERNSANPRRVLKGLKFECMDLPLQGASVFQGERQIGEITSATRSPKFECSIAMARLAIEHSKNGTALEVGMMDGRMKRLPCTVIDIPFFDPKRERARA
ncbi:MAG: DUF1989 domain-containing protein [Boseongicola sp.]|nr:DUF1989 domain-containing protein [Boseongicola sp.]